MTITWTPSGLETGKIVSYLRYLRIVRTLSRLDNVKTLSVRLFAQFMDALQSVCGLIYSAKVKMKSGEVTADNVTGFKWTDKESGAYAESLKTVRLADTPSTIEDLNGYRLRELFHEAKGFISENYDIDETAKMLKAVEKLGAEIEAEKPFDPEWVVRSNAV